jgi:hypothetical protein
MESPGHEKGSGAGTLTMVVGAADGVWLALLLLLSASTFVHNSLSSSTRWMTSMGIYYGNLDRRRTHEEKNSEMFLRRRILLSWHLSWHNERSIFKS